MNPEIFISYRSEKVILESVFQRVQQELKHPNMKKLHLCFFLWINNY